MDKVLYLAMSGARENMRSQQAHANNLANATTTGFKADFAQARAMRVMGEGHESRVYAMAERPATNTASGTLMQTGRSLDVAVDGDGWIAVMNANGEEAYTRQGELQVNQFNQLVTGSGVRVMGNGGIPITLPPFEKLDIAGDGTITIKPLGEGAADLAILDQIKLVKTEPGELFKSTDGLMHTGNNQPLLPANDVKLQSGFLESSNVNSISELTSVIDLARQFEMHVKMMKTAEENSSAAARILQLQ
ncbi:flagellar basal body rod protein FlgF [Amphritea balenae]|uniref:Flagellar basal-body rod protein FlgF n=1 Tax=Amphritea balenae TaxID=452629 RepID=A0A3P1SQA4_9GAMM|nr:flagellar basal body rod protein FlgF [Amphritea balenae]RRC99260.1 flagellar basal body rod protein FlgF [Amphritea balenae]GGK72617.1 flagellar basal-body rod protein FlgF [Amphritea balenae]